VDARTRHNVHESGPEGAQPIVFAHGFGCDQHMWRHVAPRFADRYRVVLFDHVGAGGAAPSAYDPERHERLEGYAADVVALLDELDLRDVVYVGHSVSAMIGVLAAIQVPSRFADLVLVGPSPRYLDDPDTGYVGGFGPDDIDGLLESLESNYLGWSAAMAPAIVGNADRPELGAELTESFCRADPEIQRRFARATFLADNRADLELVRTPALVMQCSDDIIAPEVVGRYVHRHLDESTFVQLEATGHCPNLSAPDETTATIERYLRSRAA
jgi:sigma-B regulation protein RsbQ